MRKIFFLPICFMLVSVAIFGNDTGKIKIAILPFYVKGNLDVDLGGLFYENFISSINEGGKYSAIEKSSIEKTFNSLKIQKNRELDNQTAMDVGAAIRAQVVLIGSITVFDNEYFVSIKGIDANNGNELFREKDQAANSRDLLKLADSFAKFVSQNNKVAGGKVDTKNNMSSNSNYNKRSNINSANKNNGNGDFRDVYFFIDSPEYGFGHYAKKFMTKYYIKWGISPEDYTKSYYKYKDLWRQAKGLIISGAICGVLLWGLGFFWLPFCAIPIFRASMVRFIYSKATGTDLLANTYGDIIDKLPANSFVSDYEKDKKITLPVLSWTL